MNLVLFLQVVFIFVMFGLNLLCILLPLKIIPKEPEKLLGKKSRRIISWCGCLSGGVFLGTCYLQLIPLLNSKMLQVFIRLGADVDYSATTTQCLVMSGFFLVLLIEQSVLTWQDQKASQKGPQNYQLVNSNINSSNPPSGQEAVSEIPDGYVASSDSTDDTEDLLGVDDAKTMMLKKKPTKSAAKVKANNNHCSSGNHVVVDDIQGHHSEGGHGHSHMLDIVQENHGLRAFVLLIALSVHSLFEGMAVGLQESIMALVNVFLGVLLHECLIAFSIGLNLAQQRGLKRDMVVKLSVAFSLMIPVGMAVGLSIEGATGVGADITSAIIQGIAAGTFVYVIFLEILPAEINHSKDRLLKVLFIVTGFLIMLCLQFAMTEHV